MPSPYEIRTVKCANCGTVKKEGNHWYITWVSTAQENGNEVVTSGGEVAKFNCQPYSEKMELDTWHKPSCSNQCSQQLFEKYLSEENL